MSRRGTRAVYANGWRVWRCDPSTSTFVHARRTTVRRSQVDHPSSQSHVFQKTKTCSRSPQRIISRREPAFAIEKTVVDGKFACGLAALYRMQPALVSLNPSPNGTSRLPEADSEISEHRSIQIHPLLGKNRRADPQPWQN